NDTLFSLMNRKILAGAIMVQMVFSVTSTFAAVKSVNNKATLIDDRISSSPTRPGVEVQIMGDGKTIVRGATVTAKNDSSFDLTPKWGALPLTWNVKIDHATEIPRRFGGK